MYAVHRHNLYVLPGKVLKINLSLGLELRLFMTRGEGYAPGSYAYVIWRVLTVYKFVADKQKAPTCSRIVY